MDPCSWSRSNPIAHPGWKNQPPRFRHRLVQTDPPCITAQGWPQAENPPSHSLLPFTNLLVFSLLSFPSNPARAPSAPSYHQLQHPPTTTESELTQKSLFNFYFIHTLPTKHTSSGSFSYLFLHYSQVEVEELHLRSLKSRHSCTHPPGNGSLPFSFKSRLPSSCSSTFFGRARAPQQP